MPPRLQRTPRPLLPSTDACPRDGTRFFPRTSRRSDERGTSEYNLVGESRANAAREYLASLAVDGSRIKTVSYGKERPFCTESAESRWRENRRAYILITPK